MTMTPMTLFPFVLLVFVTIWVSRLVLNSMNRMAEHRGLPQRDKIYRLARLIYYSVLVVGLLIAASFVGPDFTHFALMTGAIGIGLGFLGLPNIFNNFFSGILILFEGRLRVGDLIELEGGVKGEIREINFRTVTLKTEEGALIFVPNSALINSRVMLNWTHIHPYRCLRIPFAVKSNANKNLIFETLPQEVKKLPLTSANKPKREPAVYLTQVEENRLIFELWVWIEEKEQIIRLQEARSIYLNMIENWLKQSDIELA